MSDHYEIRTILIMRKFTIMCWKMQYCEDLGNMVVKYGSLQDTLHMVCAKRPKITLKNLAKFQIAQTHLLGSPQL